MSSAGSMKMSVAIERWPYIAPFRITGYVRDGIDVVVVSLEKDGRTGRGEAAGVRYKNDGVASMQAHLESVRARIEAGAGRDEIQGLLPAGGARNALDCACWDLDAKLSGRPAWQLAGLKTPHPLLTLFTCGAESPKQMAEKARSYVGARALKLKLVGEAADADRVRAVREARNDVWISVDANQGFTRESLEKLLPVLVECRVELIEQPFPIGQDALLDGFDSPLPIAADESVQDRADIAQLRGRFQMVNIKLDKCGGLTEGLAMAQRAADSGLQVMVGNMGSSSLAMAPAFLLGQLCHVVDLDGPAFLKTDRDVAVRYQDGWIECPAEIWGNP